MLLAAADARQFAQSVVQPDQPGGDAEARFVAQRSREIEGRSS
jgi:hypothetical protein